MKCQRSKFFLNRKTAYINCAYMSPMMRKVAHAGKKAIMAKAQPNKITPEDFFTDINAIKKLAAQLINCLDPNRISNIPSVSYGMSIVAQNIELQSDEEVLVLKDQFPSNVYIWKEKCKSANAKLVTVSPPDTLDRRGEKWNEEVLKAINTHTKIVSMCHTHWSDGTLFHLKEIRKKCDEVGAALVIDGTQSVGALPFDVQEIRPDALVVAAYKWLMGPYTTGFAYFGERFDGGEPLEHNFINRKDSHKFSELVNYQDEFQPGAIRYDMGEKSNFILNPMLKEALKQVIKWGPENIQDYCRHLMHEPLQELQATGFSVEDEDSRGAHLLGIRIDPSQADSLQKSLKVHRVSVSVRGEFVRISPHVYNDPKDINKLVRAFREIK